MPEEWVWAGRCHPRPVSGLAGAWAIHRALRPRVADLLRKPIPDPLDRWLGRRRGLPMFGYLRRGRRGWRRSSFDREFRLHYSRRDHQREWRAGRQMLRSGRRRRSHPACCQHDFLWHGQHDIGHGRWVAGFPGWREWFHPPRRELGIYDQPEYWRNALHYRDTQRGICSRDGPVNHSSNKHSRHTHHRQSVHFPGHYLQQRSRSTHRDQGPICSAQRDGQPIHLFGRWRRPSRQRSGFDRNTGIINHDSQCHLSSTGVLGIDQSDLAIRNRHATPFVDSRVCFGRWASRSVDRERLVRVRWRTESDHAGEPLFSTDRLSIRHSNPRGVISTTSQRFISARG